MEHDYFNNEVFLQKIYRYEDGGICYNFIFDNGYGAKVAQNPRTGGYEKDLWEIAVTLHGFIERNIPANLNEKILGWLNEQEVEEVLEKIAKISLN